MFCRVRSGLPKDPVYPASLEKLGYLINEKDQVKKSENPDERFQFYLTTNERYNEVHREAMHTCMRTEVTNRLKNLGVGSFYFPQMTKVKPTKGPHVPIYATDSLKSCSRIVVVINEHYQDLGIWAYRVVNGDGGIDEGSAVGLAKELLRRSASTGLVTLNPGQRSFSHIHNQAMTDVTWSAMPRPSAVHPEPTRDPKYNSVEGHKRPDEHVRAVFESLVLNPEFVNETAKIDVICIQSASEYFLKYMDEHLGMCMDRISAIALIHPRFPPDDLSKPLRDYLMRRARAWVVSPQSLSACVGTGEEAGDLCPTFSGGDHWAECVFPTVYQNILNWFDEVHAGGKDYENPKDWVVEAMEDEKDGAIAKEGEKDAEAASGHADAGEGEGEREGKISEILDPSWMDRAGLAD